MSRKLLKLISDGQKSIEVNHGQLLKLIMVKPKTIDIIQGQLLKLFSVRENTVEFITLLKLLLITYYYLFLLLADILPLRINVATNNDNPRIADSGFDLTYRQTPCTS